MADPLARISDGADAFDLSETGEAEVTIQVADCMDEQ